MFFHNEQLAPKKKPEESEDIVVLNSYLKGSLAGRQYTEKKEVWKDRDWLYLIQNLSPDVSIKNSCMYSGMIWKAMVRDIRFLKDFGLMDYSWIPQLEATGPVEQDDNEENISSDISTGTSPLPPPEKSGKVALESYKLPVTFSVPGKKGGELVMLQGFLHCGGIIDFLQRYNRSKRCEKWVNNIFKFWKSECSAKDHTKYADRFLLFVSKYFQRNVGRVVKPNDRKLIFGDQFHLQGPGARLPREIISDAQQLTKQPETYEITSSNIVSYDKKLKKARGESEKKFKKGVHQQTLQDLQKLGTVIVLEDGVLEGR